VQKQEIALSKQICPAGTRVPTGQCKPINKSPAQASLAQKRRQQRSSAFLSSISIWKLTPYWLIPQRAACFMQAAYFYKMLDINILRFKEIVLASTFNCCSYECCFFFE
jgi:hypothetical protein